MCPGKKDCITVKVDGQKEKRQKRFLVMNLKKTHMQCLADHPDLKISLSKFCALKPPHVLPMSIRDQEVCCCKYCENASLLLTGMKQTIPELPCNEQEAVRITLCDEDNEVCVDRECEN